MKKFKVVVNGETFDVEVEELATTTQAAPVPARAKVDATRETTKAQAVSKKAKAQALYGNNAVTAPLPGNINDVKVAVGDQVNAGDVVIILEAMKMENEVTAPMNGKIKEVHVQKGQIVQSGELLLVIA